MRKLLALLVALAMLLSALPAAGFAEMEMDVEESELNDFGDDEDFDDSDEGEADDGDGGNPYDDEALENMDEDELSAMEDDGSAFEYDFGGEGYTGLWVDIPNQNMQFCLPEGWKPTEVEKAIYAAEKEDGTASMAIYLKGKNADDIEDWIEENLKPGTAGEEKSVGFYSAMVFHGKNNRLNAYIVTDGGKVLQFVFDRKTEAALEESFALNIISSLYEDWFDDDELMGEMEAEAAQ